MDVDQFEQEERVDQQSVKISGEQRVEKGVNFRYLGRVMEENY